MLKASVERRSRSPRRSRASPPPSKGRKRSPSPDQEKGTPSPTDHTRRPKATSGSPVEDDVREVKEIPNSSDDNFLHKTLCEPTFCGDLMA